MIPQEIRDRYRNGEREIRVSPDVFAAYADSLVANYRRDPLPCPRDGFIDKLFFKDAKVIRTQ